MKGDKLHSVITSQHQSRDNCPPDKSPRRDSEISLETLEILLTSVPNEEISLAGEIQDTQGQLHQDQIEKVLMHKNHYLKRLHHLKKKKRGAEWLYRNLSFFQSQFPWELISLVENMAHEHAPDIICKTLKPINELSHRKTTESPYQENIVGSLEGLEILTTNIRRLVFNSLEDPLNRLNQQTIENACDEELTVWNDWCASIESHFKHIEELLTAGQAFFSIRNFRLMEQLPVSKRSQQALKRIIEKSVPVKA